MVAKRLAVAAVSAVMAVAAGPAVTAVAQGQRFPDVPADHYAFKAIQWAASAGVALGYGDGTFKPSVALGRWHALVFMERYYDEILGADESADFTRADMMVLLKAINDGTLRTPDTAEDPFEAVSAGGGHSCGLRTNGTITCWGWVPLRLAGPADTVSERVPDTDDAEHWVQVIPPNPVWLEEYRAVWAFTEQCCQSSEDEEALIRMWNGLLDGCDYDGFLCRGLPGPLDPWYSRRACPRGWSWSDGSFQGLFYMIMCFHPDQAGYGYSGAHYPAEEADPRGVRRDHWVRNAG